MTKLEFMKELESLLLGIPLEEREEALQYYQDYFEDAGEDHEEEIIKELGSPKRVASIIKADLNSNAADRESRGYFTENGYQDSIFDEEKFELVGADKKTSDHKEQSNNYKSSNDNSTNRNGFHGANQTNATPKKAQNNPMIIILIIIACFFASPFILAVLGVFIGVVSAVIGIIIGFGVTGIAFIGAGIALFVAGLIQLGVPFVGLLLCGGGLIILGLGMLITIACGLLCTKALPAMVKGIVNLCRAPFKNRSVIA